MANKHLKKKFSITRLSREMPIKTPVRYHCTPVNLSKINETDHTTCCQGCGGTETHTLLAGM